MKIALINENSQAAKNEMICATLKKVVEPMGHEVFNYGMCGAEDPNSLTYVQNGILAVLCSRRRWISPGESCSRAAQQEDPGSGKGSNSYRYGYHPEESGS